MSKLSDNSSSQDSQKPFLDWLQYTLSHPGTRMRCRIRGNILHILYEGDPCPNQDTVSYRVLEELNAIDINQLVCQSEEIYQIWLYGRSLQQQKPAWTFRINLDQLGHYLHHFTVKPVSDLASSSQVVAKTITSGDEQSQIPSSPGSESLPTSLSSKEIHELPVSGATSKTIEATSSSLHQDEDSDKKSVSSIFIARHLGEVLNHLGISVKVRAKTLLRSDDANGSGATFVRFPSGITSNRRLFIACQSSYSPSASLIAEPIARKLRSLNLTDFQDAIVCVRVNGEEQPDWTLRIDLTSNTIFLEEWAKWGDVEALSHLINLNLKDLGVSILTASHQETTLHLGYQLGVSLAQSDQYSISNDIEATPSNLNQANPQIFSTRVTSSDVSVDDLESDEFVNSNGSRKEQIELVSNSLSDQNPYERNDIAVEPNTLASEIKTRVQALLQEISPQGIQAAVLYGHHGQGDAPCWAEYLTLSGQEDESGHVTSLELAQQGDLRALAYLISRVLNPDLDSQLATGGIRVQLLQRDTLIHVMCDAPICPRKEYISPKVVQLLLQIQPSNIEGIRIYGRRAGLRVPTWSSGKDFVTRYEWVPKPEPEFAASDAYVSELVDSTEESPLRDELTSAEIWARWSKLRHKVAQRVKRSLLQTQLVSPTSDSPVLALPDSIRKHGLKTAAVWAAVGILSVIQIDLLFGNAAQKASDRINSQEAQVSSTVIPQTLDGGGNPIDISPVAAELSNPEGPASGSSLVGVVPGSVATTLSVMQTELLDQSPYPTFNSNQLDLKLALYYQHIAEIGTPDVLIIGSSRALRGIDPVVLEDALTNLGYENADVFNFGINGATAQVVELVIHRILAPEQLPELILWADGARAFNGGRKDQTYEGIAESEGYQQLSEGNLQVPIINGHASSGNEQSEINSSNWITSFSTSLTRSYGEVDDWLSNQLGGVSTAHDSRDALKAVIQDGLTGNITHGASLVFGNSSEMSHSSSSEVVQAQNLNNETDTVTADRVIGHIGTDGFLPLDVRFDPATYYEQYSRVPGNYDKDYANFQLSGQQGEALNTLLQLGSTHDVPIVFINLPLTGEYLDPYRMAYEQEFRQHLLTLDLEHDEFIFRDLSEMWLVDGEPSYYRYFSDPSHLNRYGAIEVAKRLAQDPMIPWTGSEF